MALNTTRDLWKHLGKDAYTKVRSEIVGTGNSSTTVFSLSHDNIISGSETIYTDGTVVSSGLTIDYDDGKVTFSSAPGSGVVVTADYDYSDVPDSVISSILDKAYNYLTASTGRTFQTGSEVEYLDVDEGQTEFFLSNYPITSINYVSSNTASSITSEPAWKSLSEGVGNDYIAYLKEGRLKFIDNKPLKGEKRLKVSYDYGTENLELAKELELLIAQRHLIQSTVYKSIFKGYDNFTPVRLEEIENRINELRAILSKQDISTIPSLN